LKFSRKTSSRNAPMKVVLLCGTMLAVALSAIFVVADAVPDWIQNIEAKSALEAVMFRAVALPTGPITIRRPPAETVPAFAEHIKQQPDQADLYSLKALEEEAKLDFDAAEADWKLYLQHSNDKEAAEMAMADFYHRRHRPKDELIALMAIGNMPSPATEKFTAPAQQSSWQAFERSLNLIQSQALGRAAWEQLYTAWIVRYPREPSLYARYFEVLLHEKDFKAATALIAQYRNKFPNDEIFPTRAQALIAYRQGSVEQGLAVYDKAFQPLWPPELVKNYFDLLKETRNERKFLEQARATLVRNPDDLLAVTRIFYYYQQHANIAAAQQAFTEYRLQKEARKAVWTEQELYTFARLLEDVHLYPESARYYYALYKSGEGGPQEKSIAGLSRILLTAPEQEIRFGSGDLSMYQDIATIDQGPGYLNGILSLILNTEHPAEKYIEEEQRAAPYFHRARAAELIALLDRRFPTSEFRPDLHVMLIQAYAEYGQDEPVVKTGREFLAAFPSSPQRNQIALLMANAYQRLGNDKEEFTIYDAMLQELARKADGVPIGASVQESKYQVQPGNQVRPDVPEGDGDESEGGDRRPAQKAHAAFQISKDAPGQQSGPRSPEYQHVLDRYISRLVAARQIPAALTVWRQELDRNSNDPGLYEHFANFLENNRLGTEEESIYKRAIQQFQSRDWYHRLARWYLSTKRNQQFEALSNEVLKTFSGTEFAAYLRSTGGGPINLEFQFNQFAHQKFPHNLSFVHSLLHFYNSRQFYNQASWEALLRQYWMQDEGLRNELFAYLSRTGKLESELDRIRAGTPDHQPHDLGERTFTGQAELWRSHFEAAAPLLLTVARQYPADAVLNHQAASVYRSLAYFDPKATDIAVELESNLLKADPANREQLARIGDIYSDRELFSQASPYWNRMAETEPGNPQGFQDAATVYWDYYFFDDALRLLNEGRTRLNDSSLYGYQLGAIYENKRDYPHAVDEYLRAALLEGEGGQSRARLLQLAARKSTRDLVDSATSKAVSDRKYDLDSINTRVAVLEAQKRNQEVVTFLIATLDQAGNIDVIESVENLAKEKSLEPVRQRALEREAAVSVDPIRRLELRYELVRFYEQKKDISSAQQNIEALYRDNPRILGVVRSTIDFYSHNKLQSRAIDVLLQSAHNAYPALRTQFNYEAARKMTDAGQYQQARILLIALLNDNPNNAEYVAAVADTFARAGDQAGLRDFYNAQIKYVQKAQLSADERKTRLASLRRGLIPALTILKDYAGAVDQYVEIINAFPDDAAVTSEAAFYAQRYQRKDQLQNFYAKTVAASPKDSRWAVVLARVQGSYEDFDDAIKTYSDAIKIRPDRADLLTARAALEERLMRFEEAAKDYRALYDLAYHDPKWMEKVAEIRARQSKPDLAVQALQVALVDGRPEAPAKYFIVADRLESWGMVAEARTYAERGVKVAGDGLLADSANHAGARTYVRIMTQARQYEVAYHILEDALNSAGKMPLLSSQNAKNNIEAASNAELRQHLLETRRSIARNGFAACTREIGSAMARYFTPEEKAATLAWAGIKNASLGRMDAHSLLLPLVEAAGFTELQVKLNNEMLMITARSYQGAQSLEQLQTRRLQLAELGAQLEAASPMRQTAPNFLSRAQEIFRLANRPSDELRVLETMQSRAQLPASLYDRYFTLLLNQNVPRLTALTQRKDMGDAATNFMISHGASPQTYAAIAARSQSEAAVWKPAYTALTGLYFKDSSAPVDAAFQTALGTGTIGQQLDGKIDRHQTLAGDVWYYYGSRYGEYLGATHKGDDEDFTPAELEHTPANVSAYFNVARYYEDAGELDRAASDFLHVLELSPSRIDAHNRLAGIYSRQKRADDSLAEEKLVIQLLRSQAGGKTSSTFVGDYAATIAGLSGRKQLSQFMPDVLDILRSYVKTNGDYSLVELVRSTYPATEPQRDATSMALDLCNGQKWRTEFLRDLLAPAANVHVDQEQIYRSLLESAQADVESSEGYLHESHQAELQQIQLRWLQSLLKAHQLDRLRDQLALLPPASLDNLRDSLAPIQIKLAAETNAVDPLINSYRSDPEHAPSAELLRRTATELSQSGDKQSARKLLEFVFSREVENHNLTVANMIGLADIRIQSGDVDGGVILLRRMALVVGSPFETQEPSAAMLVRTGHPAEAVPFLEEMVRAVPWNPDYRVRLAQARLAANQTVDVARKDLLSVATSSNVPYDVRVNAAASLGGISTPPALGSKELDLIASGKAVPADTANQPFFFAVRLKAAETLPAAGKVSLLRNALEDYPNGDAARVPLLKAAFQTGDYPLVIAVVKPQMQTNAFESAYSRSHAEDEDELFEDQESQQNAQQGFGKLPAKEWAEISRDVGTAFHKTGQLDQALVYLRRAYRLEKDAATKTQINKEVQQVRATQRTAATNLARQPLAHTALEQEHIVRPRTGAAPVPARTAAPAPKGAL